jgi:hypothetical protein
MSPFCLVTTQAQRRLDAPEEVSLRHPVTSFPLGQGARVNVEAGSQFLLGYASTYPPPDEGLTHSLRSGARVVSEEFDDGRPALQVRRAASCQPIGNARCVYDHALCGGFLSSFEIENSLPQVVS